MSRKGKIPVTVPAQVKASVSGNCVAIEGPKGKLKKEFHGAVEIKQEGEHLTVRPTSSSRLSRAMYGTARAILQNMVDGAVKGFSKQIEIVGVGFRATVKGAVLDLALGYSHPILYKIPEGVTVVVADNTKVTISGADKHAVGQVAADIKHFYPHEPYKGKGVRIVGEHLRRKEGKKTA